ncbi:spore coat protein GerQ [Cohnella abietis]|uniref:Spore coat protein GerQ n=1 Tax=Cohnella abietis TaxID=2507935 RepID=A0A3T1DAN3_9BACL|nr:spore coat protein GerQ [Cohnella abietis]BBI35129.1 spore coat protein GerQ [Cohnella abietis]
MYNKMPWPVYPQNQAPTSMMPMGMPASNMMSTGTPGATIMPNMAMMQGMSPPPVTNGVPILQNGMTLPAPPTQEESYVENILRMNLGKVATLYMTYENNSEWNAKIFKGVLEAAGRDHIIISDPVTGKRYLLLTLNLDYITFDEPINYNLPFGSNPNR